MNNNRVSRFSSAACRYDRIRFWYYTRKPLAHNCSRCRVVIKKQQQQHTHKRMTKDVMVRALAQSWLWIKAKMLHTQIQYYRCWRKPNAYRFHRPNDDSIVRLSIRFTVNIFTFTTPQIEIGSIAFFFLFYWSNSIHDFVTSFFLFIVQ